MVVRRIVFLEDLSTDIRKMSQAKHQIVIIDHINKDVKNVEPVYNFRLLWFNEIKNIKYLN